MHVSLRSSTHVCVFACLTFIARVCVLRMHSHTYCHVVQRCFNIHNLLLSAAAIFCLQHTHVCKCYTLFWSSFVVVSLFVFFYNTNWIYCTLLKYFGNKKWEKNQLKCTKSLTWNLFFLLRKKISKKHGIDQFTEFAHICCISLKVFRSLWIQCNQHLTSFMRKTN